MRAFYVNIRSIQVTDNLLKLIVLVTALIVAALAITMRVDAPVVWTFLTLVVTAVLGRKQ